METTIALLTTIVAVALWALATKLIRESVETITIWDYQTGLHFKDGKYIESLSSGKHRFWGRGHSVILYDSRIAELVVQGQELITADSATVKLTAVAQWRIADAVKFHVAVDNAHQALYTRIQLAMRSVMGGLDLDAVIEQKTDFGKSLLNEVKSDTLEEFGVEVLRIEIRDVMLSGELKNSYASVITARKEAQAKQERARGEAAALRTMANAARAFQDNPDLLRLRYLEALKEAGTGYGNQLIIGVPNEWMSLVKKET